MKRKRCVEDLVSASVCDIARQSEVSQYIADGIFQSSEDKEEVDNNATKFLEHICNNACKVRNADGTSMFSTADATWARPLTLTRTLGRFVVAATIGQVGTPDSVPKTRCLV